MKRVVLISQARLGSSRLPEKVLKPLLGRSMIARQYDRLMRAKSLDQVCFAIPDTDDNDKLRDHLHAMGASVSRGPEMDALSRFAICAREQDADIVVRVTSDCPFIAPELIDQTVNAFLDADVDYAYMDLSSCARGFDTEVFSAKVLYEAEREATSNADREHVTSFIYTHPERFRLLGVKNMSKALENGRLCVDTLDDFLMAEAIIKAFGDAGIAEASADQIMRFVEGHDEVRAMNAHVEQKLLSH